MAEGDGSGNAQSFVHGCRYSGNLAPSSPGTHSLHDSAARHRHDVADLRRRSAGPRPRGEAAGTQRRHNEGHGRRLTAAFEALEAFPALAESRDRVIRLATAERISVADIVGAVESDVALVISVLRVANDLEGRSRSKVESVVGAVELLSPETVQGLASRVRTYDFFERSSVWDVAPERFRLHGVATQRAADRLATETGYEERDRLMVTALLHDIGKLVLMHAYPGYPQQVHGTARTPEERIAKERRELGVDHALVGGVLARRWGLPKSVASVIERHHAEDADGEAAFVRLADMLAHYAPGRRRLADRAPALRAHDRPRADGAAQRHVRPALPGRLAHPPDRPVPAVRRASRTSSSCSPRARSTSRSPTSCSSRRAPSAPTCTTSTASSAPSTARRRCSSPPSAAGCRPQAASRTIVAARR